MYQHNFTGEDVDGFDDDDQYCPICGKPWVDHRYGEEWLDPQDGTVIGADILCPSDAEDEEGEEDYWNYDDCCGTDEDDELDEAMQSCGYAPPLELCTKAGSEYCDWECPVRGILLDGEE